ncbi:MAG: polyprenyl synthetase family protein, partial [Elusimicrobia bacterium]|nr:polyprenyl synthetase family protein [Elusimicrobiota bacterium]
MTLPQYLESRRRLVDRALHRALLPTTRRPPVIHRAMRYSVFAGGKRLRSILVIAAAEACGGRPALVMPTACALELLHTYSLIHDDLPAMDNDDLRRGRPTSHRVFGEGIAILAGDALLTLAFQTIAENAKIHDVHAAVIPQVLEVVAKGAGTLGMIGGQVVDLEMAQRRWSLANPRAQVQYIHRHKTAALIQASVLAGALLAGASRKQQQALGLYGERIGMGFQIVDDILDLIGDKAKLG